ncbi:MAG: TonB-dependent receptor [Opitutus sp.]|nr:TonB-dependent receptor [Opitutus sp.]
MNSSEAKRPEMQSMEGHRGFPKQPRLSSTLTEVLVVRRPTARVTASESPGTENSRELDPGATTISRSMTSKLSPSLRCAVRLLAGLLACWSILLPMPAQVDATSVIVGRVRNAGTGDFLEGAAIELVGTGVVVLSERDGSFRISAAPAVERSIRVTYTGLDPVVRTLAVADGRRVDAGEIGLSSGLYALEKYVVAGTREGSALAMTTQRNAPNVKNVAAVDTFGNVANGNPADLLVYLPGVTADYVGNEVRTIQVRGMDPSLTSMTIDGTKLASSQSAGVGRQFEFETASLANIESVELNKALTPDLEADSIGGSVNLKTKSAFERGERRITISAGATVNPRNDIFPDYSKWGWSASAEFSDLFGPEKRFGVIFSSTYYIAATPTDAVQPRFQNTITSPAYVYQLVAPRPAAGPRERKSHSVKFEYKLNDRTQFHLGMFYNTFFETSHPRIYQLTTAQTIATVNAQGQPTGTGAILPDYTDVTTEARQLAGTRADVTVRWFPKAGRTYRFNPGGRYRSEGLELDWDFSYSYSDTRYDWRQATARLANIGWRIQREAPSSPIFHYTQTAGPDMYNLANYSGFVYTKRGPWNGYDDILSGQINGKKTFRATYPFFLKSGLKYRAQQRNVKRTDRTYTYTGPQSISRFLDPQWDYDKPTSGYRTPPWIGMNETETIFQANPGQFSENVIGTLQSGYLNNKKAREAVSAAYLMGETGFGSIKVLGGVRLERTELDGAGPRQEITPTEKARRAAYAGPVTLEENLRRTVAEYGNRRDAHSTYTSVFPSLHARHRLTPGLLARASWATGIGRADFGNIIPTLNADHDRETVVATNPGLKPQYSNNYDVSLEYYFQSVGVLSAGWFYKDIKNFIFSDTRIISAGSGNGFDGEYGGYLLSTSGNGGYARVRGFELNYSQQLTMLPGFLRFLGLLANYTQITTKGNYASGGTTTQSTDQIAGFIPKSGNAGLSFGRNGAEIRLLWNWTGKYLAAFSSSPAQLQYNAPRELVNIKTKWRVTRHYSIYFDALNIMNTPGTNIYTYTSNRLFNYTTGSPRYYFGITGTY